MIRRENGQILFVGSALAYYLETKEIEDVQLRRNKLMKNRIMEKIMKKRAKFNIHHRRKEIDRPKKAGHDLPVHKDSKVVKEIHLLQGSSTFKHNL